MKPLTSIPVEADQACSSCHQMQKMMASFPGILCTIDQAGIFTFISDSVERICGYQPEELLGRLAMQMVYEEDRDKTKSTAAIVSTGKEIKNFHNRWMSKQGNLIHLLWSASWHEEDQVMYCCAQENTALASESQLQHQYEKKLKEYNRKLYDIVERIGDAFLALDENARVIYWNRQAELIMGKPREEVLTRPIWECYPETIDTSFFAYYKRAIRDQKPQQYEAFFPTADKWFEITIYPSKNGLTSFLRDITERKNIEERLEKQKAENQKKITAAVIQAQEKERTEVGQELHDNVNQVLTTVKLYNELCMTGTQNNEELLKRSTELLQSCINEIRSLSRQLSAPSLGKIRMKDSVKELVEAIAATGKTCINLDTKGIVDLEVNDEVHLGIYRILQEHLTNILRHADATSVKIIIDYLDDDLIVKVTDNGRGFNTRERKGGIGISNMISRAESLGGKLTLNSAPGLGCVLIAHFRMLDKQ